MAASLRGRVRVVLAASTLCLAALDAGDAAGTGRPAPPPAELPACDQRCWGDAVAAYVADPVHARRHLLALAARGTADLPPATLLVLADAHLRAGHARAAQTLFSRVAAAEPAEPLRSWALLGDAWVSLRGGDTERAMALLIDAQRDDAFEPATVLLLALLELSRGDPSGTRRLRELAAEPRATRDVRAAARLAIGLASYWSGDPHRAREHFEEVAADPDAGALEDEGRYAAARMTLAEGRVAEARRLLENMLSGQGVSRDARRGVKITSGMLDLDRRELLRKGVTGYRRTAVSAPSVLVVQMLDWNGHALARALLARLDRGRRDHAPDDAQPLPVAVSGSALRSTLPVGLGEGGETSLGGAGVNPQASQSSRTPGSAMAMDAFRLTPASLIVLAALTITACAVALLRRRGGARG